jgi:PAS domain S-box-containing protein
MSRSKQKSSQLNDPLYPILLTQIYERSNIGIIATVINSSILLLILWNQISHWILVVWFLTISLVCLIRIFLNLKFLRLNDAEKNIHRWGQLLFFGLGISGILWGSTAIILFPIQSLVHQVFIAFVLAGMTAGAVGVYSPIMPVLLAFIIPALLPIIVRFVIIYDTLHLAMAAMVTLFAILTFRTAQHINSSTRELIALKETFADRLETRTVELKNTNELLKQEIGERKQAEKALVESERRLNEIIEFLPDPTWVIDIEGRVIAWNRAIEQTTGINKKDIIGKGGYVHAVPFYGEPRPTLIDLALRRDKRWEKEYLSLKEKNGLLIAGESFHPLMGEGYYFAASASRLYDSLGNVTGAIESIRDITAAKHLEEEREQLIAELQKAILKVQTLRGLLPICASCKSIRDDKGYWNKLEAFISEHSEAQFSHGICPECAKKLYPEVKIYDD